MSIADARQKNNPLLKPKGRQCVSNKTNLNDVKLIFEQNRERLKTRLRKCTIGRSKEYNGITNNLAAFISEISLDAVESEVSFGVYNSLKKLKASATHGKDDCLQSDFNNNCLAKSTTTRTSNPIVTRPNNFTNNDQNAASSLFDYDIDSFFSNLKNSQTTEHCVDRISLASTETSDFYSDNYGTYNDSLLKSLGGIKNDQISTAINRNKAEKNVEFSGLSSPVSRVSALLNIHSSNDKLSGLKRVSSDKDFSHKLSRQHAVDNRHVFTTAFDYNHSKTKVTNTISNEGYSSSSRPRKPNNLHPMSSIKQSTETAFNSNMHICNMAFDHKDLDAERLSIDAELDRINLTVFGYKSFRPLQREAIKSVIDKQDVMCIFPTGGGKSLVYIVAAVYLKKVTLVIMPLLSLINDQLNKCLAMGLVAMIYSSSQELLNKLTESTCCIVFTTPEKIGLSSRLLTILQQLQSANRLGMIVIDEAHCISSWGCDFRPDYRKMGSLLSSLYVPRLALTASATDSVKQDIIRTMKLTNCRIFCKSVVRPNLVYEVNQVPRTSEISNELITLLTNRFFNQCGIIYCISRKECAALVKLLAKNKIKAECFHAGLSTKLRNAVQTRWMENKFKIIIATIAFGMGIDKPDVRFVIHVALPKSLDSYYQESGRAGRDEQTAHCILLYNEKQRLTHYWFSHFLDSNRNVTSTKASKSLRDIISYVCNLSKCRKSLLSQHFNDKTLAEPCQSTCDNCILQQSSALVQIDVLQYVFIILDVVSKLSLHQSSTGGLTMRELIEVLSGRSIKKMKNYVFLKQFQGSLKSLGRKHTERLMLDLFVKSYIDEKVVKIGKKSIAAYLTLGSCKLAASASSYPLLALNNTGVETDISIDQEFDSEEITFDF